LSISTQKSMLQGRVGC